MGQGCDYGRQAGARLPTTRRSAGGDVTSKQALAALGHLPETPDTRGLAIDLRLGLAGDALYRLGEYERGSSCSGRPGPSSGAPRSGPAGSVLARLANMLRIRADFAAPWRRASRPLPSRPRLATYGLQERVLYLGIVYWAIGDYGRAAELFRRNVEARDPSTGRPIVRTRSFLWRGWRTL